MHLSWKYWVPTLAFLQHLVFWRATISKREYLFILGEVVYLGLLVSILSPWTLIFAGVMYLFMVELINFPHHLGLKQYTGEERFSIFEQEDFVRSCVYPKWFAHFALLNFNLHIAHHAFPTYPWYQLDEIHQAMKDCGRELNIDDRNRWIFKNRALALDRVFDKTFED
jgi:fatty acid desaturase